MASPSPALSNNSAETTPISAPAGSAVAGSTTATKMMINSSSINTSKNLRGLNKPKCIKCGNVARSRCPYQACKSCCAKDQNPCHIHVLKGTSSFPDKRPSLSSPSLDQHTNETSSSGNSHRVTSLRQLSNNFAQFNNLQTPVRSRKPLSRKEALQINEWRFSKLKEYKDRNIEVENEAFDRYLKNISLLEEVFAVNSLVSNPNPNSVEETSEMTISKLKMKLRADPIRIENFKDRMQFIVNNGLRKLKRFETENGGEEVENVNLPKKARYLGLMDLNKKLTNARTQEDLEICQQLKGQIFGQPKKSTEESESSNKQDHKVDISTKPKSEVSTSKWFNTITIDQEALNLMDAQFCSLGEIENL